MYKAIVLLIVAIIGCVLAAPNPGVIAPFTAAVVAPPAVVTAQSSQVIARNYNGLVAPVVAAPIVRSAQFIAAPAAPLLAAAPIHSHAYPYYTAGHYHVAPSTYVL